MTFNRRTFLPDLDTKYGTIYRVWFDLLIEEQILGIAPETWNDVIEHLFITDKVEPVHFVTNYKALLSSSTTPDDEIIKPTPSLVEIMKLEKIPGFVPTWFHAAYPDVILWSKYKLSDSVDPKVADSNGNYGLIFLRGLVDQFLAEKGLTKVEVAV